MMVSHRDQIKSDAWSDEEQEGKDFKFSEMQSQLATDFTPIPLLSGPSESTIQPKSLSRTAKSSKSTDKTSKPLEIPPPLQAFCLGVLALASHLEELIECGEDVLPYCPAEAKACLLSAARRQKLLTNEALKILIDEDHTALDVHNTPSITPHGLLTAVKMAPNLRFVDVRGIFFGPKFLKSLATACPLIQVLRLGGNSFPAVELERIGFALLDVLPLFDKSKNNSDARTAVAASWEESEALAIPEGRLMNLRCLIWQEIPHEIKKMAIEQSPAVVINPSMAEIKEKRLPRESDPELELDEVYAKQVVGYDTWKDESVKRIASKEQKKPEIHIAEKFRMAYASQEKRLKKRDARLWRKATRESLVHSSGERLIRQWEYDF